MKVVVPTPIATGMYVAYPTANGYSNTGDYAAHSMVTAYVVGNRVIVDSLKSQFECVVNHTGTLPTLTMTTPWVRVGASNAWRPFDSVVSSQSIGYTFGDNFFDRMTYKLVGVGRITTVCVLATDASFVRVTFSPDGGATLTYNKTIKAVDTTPVIDAWTYFFADLNVARDFVFDDIDGWGATSAAEIKIVVSNDYSASAVAVGEIVVGRAYEIGDCHAGAKMSMNDFSRKESNAFGDLELVERAYSFTGTFELEIPTARRNTIQSLLTKLRATPSVYFPSLDDANDGLIVYGFERSFDITYETPERSFASLEIEGLT